MAAYDPKTNILFLHVPKTGGSSITHSFFNTLLTFTRPKNDISTHSVNVNLEKFDSSSVSDMSSPDWGIPRPTKDSFLFTSVRDPYERFYSFYYTHMITKRRVVPEGFSEENFENFIIYDWQAYIKSKTTSRKNSQDPQKACRDKNFKAWIKRDPLVSHKACQNIYKKYYSIEHSKEQPKIRFLLFDNIQEEYKKMLEYGLRENMMCFDEKSLEALEKRLYQEKCRAKKATKRDWRWPQRIIDEGLELVNIAPTRGSSQLNNTRNPALVKRPAIDFYTPKARKVFDRFNQEDIKFYNKLKSMTFEERFETPHAYFDLVKDE